jgi:hypothetical protein
MSKSAAVFLTVVSLASVIWVAAYAPRWIDDHNEFMRGFINHELLAILGVILAITLASASQIHLKFNEIEEKNGRVLFARSRGEIKSSCYCLIFSFLGAIACVFLKPLFAEHHFAVAFINGACLWVLLFNILILFDITSGIFQIQPQIKDQPALPPPTPALSTPPERTR